MKKRLFSTLFLLFSLTLYSADLADFYSAFTSLSSLPFFSDKNTGLTVFPTLLVPMGGLYEGMGTAYTAVSIDSGFIESNPAGSSLLDYTELTLNHNNWIADTNIEGVVYTTRFDNLGIGIGGTFLYVPFIGYNRWGEEEASGYYSETIATMNLSYNFFSSYYFYGISLGANIKAAYRHIPEELYADKDVGNQSSPAIMTDIGFISRFNFLKFYAARERNFSVGAVVKNLGPDVQNEPLPTIATGGISYSPIRPILISFDYNYPFSLSLPADQWEKWNIAAGINAVVTDFFSIHAGFSHRGSNPKITIGSGLILEKINININYTLDMTTQLTAVDKFSIEATVPMGDGGRKVDSRKVDEYYIAGLESYAKGDLNKAIEFWKVVLEIDPTFQPASENLIVAQTSITLQKNMEALHVVE
jgi:tetratricopeptide (TPR) repeat protein